MDLLLIIVAGPAVNSKITAVDYKGLYLFYTPVKVGDPMCYKSRILTAAEASCAVSFSSKHIRSTNSTETISFHTNVVANRHLAVCSLLAGSALFASSGSQKHCFLL